MSGECYVCPCCGWQCDRMYWDRGEMQWNCVTDEFGDIPVFVLEDGQVGAVMYSGDPREPDKLIHVHLHNK